MKVSKRNPVRDGIIITIVTIALKVGFWATMLIVFGSSLELGPSGLVGMWVGSLALAGAGYTVVNQISRPRLVRLRLGRHSVDLSPQASPEEIHRSLDNVDPELSEGGDYMEQIVADELTAWDRFLVLFAGAAGGVACVGFGLELGGVYSYVLGFGAPLVAVAWISLWPNALLELARQVDRGVSRRFAGRIDTWWHRTVAKAGDARSHTLESLRRIRLAIAERRYEVRRH